MQNELLNKNSYSRSSKALLLEGIPFITASYGVTVPHFFIPTTKQFQYTTEVAFDKYVEDAELTQLCMNISEISLSKDWNKEEDERWDMFLND